MTTLRASDGQMPRLAELLPPHRGPSLEPAAGASSEKYGHAAAKTKMTIRDAGIAARNGLACK
jgi:hypothetical protein